MTNCNSGLSLIAVSLVTALVVGACASPPPQTARPAVAEPAPTQPAAPTPPPEVTVSAPEPRFECPPVESEPALADYAETLRRVFGAIARGETPVELAADDVDSPLVRRAREARACPRRYEWHAALESYATFDDRELGVLPLSERDSSTGHLELAGAHEALQARADTARLRAFLAAHPGAQLRVVMAPEAAAVVVQEREATLSCVLSRATEPSDGAERWGPPACFRISPAVGRVGVLGRPDPPYRDDEEEDTPRRYRAFVELDGVTHELRDGRLVAAPVRARPSEWRRVGTLARRAPWTFEPLDAAALPWAEIERRGPESLGAQCMRGDALLCCEVAGVLRCLHPGSAMRIGTARIAPRIEGDLVTLEASTCDGGSELTECTEALHFLRVDGDALVHAGSVAMGRLADEHFREWEEGPPAGRDVIGSWARIRWRATVRAPSCVELDQPTRSAGSYHSFYPEGTRARVAREPTREVSEPVVLGERVDALPRFAPFDTEVVSAEGPTPDLRGSFVLEERGWRRVERCP
jgi:hypothetical protein